MSIRLLVLGVLVAGSVGQVACSQQAEAAQADASERGRGQRPEGGRPVGGQFCGGIAAISCPEGLMCVDDPNDTCDPNQSGRDCGGICVAPNAGTGGAGRPPRCDYEDPNRRYVSRDPEQCAVLRFVCEEGEAAFFNDCGCGCEAPPTP